MQHHGWTLLCHDAVVEQLRKAHAAAQRAARKYPKEFEQNANVRLLRTLGQLLLDAVPGDPGRDESGARTSAKPVGKRVFRSSLTLPRAN
jgi:toxin YhaV